MARVGGDPVQLTLQISHLGGLGLLALEQPARLLELLGDVALAHSGHARLDVLLLADEIFRSAECIPSVLPEALDPVLLEAPLSLRESILGGARLGGAFASAR